MPHKTMVKPKKEASREEPGARHLTNMHDFALCCEVPHVVAHHVHEQNEVPRVNVKRYDICDASASPRARCEAIIKNCPSLVFWKKGASFLSC